ncbi:MAG: YciI family protein [Myxococcota bacterium]|nr:YciI family protein [Myxococcota bacterium]
MPLFCYVGYDGPSGLARRPDVRPQHLAHMQPLAEAGRIRYAGPLLDEQGDPRGSLVVLEAADYHEARRIAETDPYLEQGVFERVDVYQTRQVLPDPSED